VTLNNTTANGQQGMEVRNLESWRVQHLRWTFFRTLSANAQPLPLWAIVAGSEPESQTVKPKEFGLVEEGVWNEHNLSITHTAHRLDLIWHSTAAIHGIPDAGAFFQVLDAFQKLGMNVPIEGVYRLAFGARLFLPAESRKDAYTKLASFLPCVQLTDEAEEFILQVNRPRISKVTREKLNRLGKWASIVSREISLHPSTSEFREAFSTVVELDISTAAESRLELEKTKFDALISEMIATSTEVAQNGDCA